MSVDLERTTTQLRDVVHVKYGKALPQTKRNAGSVPVFGSNGVVGTHDKSLTNGPAIIIGRKGSSGAINFSAGPCWPIDTTYYIDDPGPYAIEFLEWLLRSLNLTELDRSSAIPGLNRDQLYEVEVPLPSPEAQQQITGVLDRATALSASAMRHLSLVHESIDRFRQSVLAVASSGHLTAEWRESHPDVEPARTLIERSQAALAPRTRTRSMTGTIKAPDWLVLPETWEWAPLESLAEIRGGIQKQPKRVPKENAYPYLRVANVLRGRLDLSEIHQFELYSNELETYRLVPGDLLIVEGNGSLSEIGRSAIWDGAIDNCVHQNHIIRVRCPEIDPEFVDLVWNSPVGAREISELAVTSSGLYSLSAGKIRTFAIPVPPLEEQREIVRRATSLLKRADAINSRNDEIARRINQSSHAILAKILRGDLSRGNTSNSDLHISDTRELGEINYGS